ncbi:unnamed protein product [Lathyrus sativus]|nr:unnamed protein product [Lathyrus sativus]CAK8080828.1 unnamed protein product [Lathyrus sativus]
MLIVRDLHLRTNWVATSVGVEIFWPDYHLLMTLDAAVVELMRFFLIHGSVYRKCYCIFVSLVRAIKDSLYSKL